MDCMDVAADRRAPPSQVLVCQRGARHRYAVPRLFHQAGLLAALYTDSCAFSRMGRIASKLADLGFSNHRIRAVAARKPEGVPPDKVYPSDWLLLDPDSSLAGIYKRRGLQGASVVYSMYGEEAGFIEWAKGLGAKIIVDVFVHPETNRILLDEECRVLGRADFSALNRENGHSLHVFELADILLCPSEWVADGVRSFHPPAAHKIRICPYGSSVAVQRGINRRPVAGRILFAGRDPVRKGLHHLAKAAALMRGDGLDIEVRVAGVSAREISWMDYKEQLDCLGKIPMDEMKKEYAQADVFVLPSLSEGQAGVILEAMACGVPVVATRESGVDFEEGCGVVVPSRDATALAQALASVITNRSFRNELADGALRQSRLYSMDAWKDRLVAVVKEACNG